PLVSMNTVTPRTGLSPSSSTPLRFLSLNTVPVTVPPVVAAASRPPTTVTAAAQVRLTTGAVLLTNPDGSTARTANWPLVLLVRVNAPVVEDTADGSPALSWPLPLRSRNTVTPFRVVSPLSLIPLPFVSLNTTPVTVPPVVPTAVWTPKVTLCPV